MAQASQQSHEDKRLALALLALVFAAAVNIFGREGVFSPWEIMTGLVMVSVAGAYSHSLGRSFLEDISFSMIMAAGWICFFGYWVDKWLLQAKWAAEARQVEWHAAWIDSAFGSALSRFGNVRDAVYFILWTAISLIVWVVRSWVWRP